LKACDEHDIFENEMRQTVPKINVSDDNRGENGRARRDQNQHLEKSPKSRPEQKAPDDYDGHATSPRCAVPKQLLFVNHNA